jgi:hypothetical protein
VADPCAKRVAKNQDRAASGRDEPEHERIIAAEKNIERRNSMSSFGKPDAPKATPPIYVPRTLIGTQGFSTTSGAITKRYLDFCGYTRSGTLHS